MAKQRDDDTTIPNSAVKEHLKAAIERELINSTPSLDLRPARFSQVSHGQEVDAMRLDSSIGPSSSDEDARIKEYADRLVRLQHGSDHESSDDGTVGESKSIH